MYPLTTTDSPCTEHKDCTATTFSNDFGIIGVRHLHQWLDPQGLDLPDRSPTDYVFGAWNVGILVGYDPETGAGIFDPDASVLTASVAGEDVDPASRLTDEIYCVANDMRTEPPDGGSYPKIIGSRRPMSEVVALIKQGRSA